MFRHPRKPECLVHGCTIPARESLRSSGKESRLQGYVILCGHGNEDGFILGEYGPQIDSSMLVKGSMPDHVFGPRVNLPGKVVVSTACCTGGNVFKEVFKRGGAAAYIGPDGYPDGTDAAPGAFVFL